jgi:hypothetical protein
MTGKFKLELSVQRNEADFVILFGLILEVVKYCKCFFLVIQLYFEIRLVFKVFC